MVKNIISDELSEQIVKLRKEITRVHKIVKPYIKNR